MREDWKSCCSPHRLPLFGRAQVRPCTSLHAPQLGRPAALSLHPSLGQQAPVPAAFVPFFFFFPSKIQQVSIADSFKRMKWEINCYLRGLSTASLHLAGAENQLQPPSASQRVLLVYLKALGEVLQRQGQTR